VSLNRVAKRLRREAVANPKKAALLGLLAVVALYFWAPLMCGWFNSEDSPKEAKSAKADAKGKSIPDAASEPGSKQKEKAHKTPEYSWQQLAEWMDNDPRTSAARSRKGQRDPFRMTKAQLAQVKPNQEQENQVKNEEEPELTPQDLGMVLSSTIVGPRRQVALINGKTYRPGDTIEMEKGKQKVSFTLMEILPRRVVLSRENKPFTLNMPSSNNSGQINLLGNTK